MNQTKKIAFVYDAIYPYIKGGAERRYYEIGKRLATQGYDVHLYGMKLWEGPDTLQQDGMTLHGLCTAKKLYTHNGKRSIGQALHFGISCFKLLTEDFDIIDCCEFPYFSLFTCKLVCLLKGKKLYSTWHEVWGKAYWKEYVGTTASFATWIEKKAALMPDTIVSVSQTTAERITTVLGVEKKITISPNGIDLSEINKVKPAAKQSDIIYAGRLMDFKHIDILIEAIALVKQTEKNIRCIIIGDGPEKNRLEKLVKKYNLEKHILFLGFLKHHSEVYAYFKSSKIFVLPSTREGFGIAILEANACGLKAVTINHPNNAATELINSHTGELAEPNEKSLAKHIENLLNKKQDIGEKQVVKEHYNWDLITKNLLTIYN